VAWRINKRLGIKFHNQYKGTNWGNANTWDNAAKKTGVKVNSTPKPGAVAQTNAGSYGHVAWVTAVNGNKVTIEEYNWGKREGYSKRTVDKSAFNYIHVKA
jgi:surface antigen